MHGVIAVLTNVEWCMVIAATKFTKLLEKQKYLISYIQRIYQCIGCKCHFKKSNRNTKRDLTAKP